MSDYPLAAEERQDHRSLLLEHGAATGRYHAMELMMSVTCFNARHNFEPLKPLGLTGHETCIGNADAKRCLCPCHDAAVSGVRAEGTES